jgi:phosphoesterase RecJ-like protein
VILKIIMAKLESTYKEIFQNFVTATNILIIGHLSPDGDALSSVCALLELAERYDISARGFCQGCKSAGAFDYLPHIQKIAASPESLGELKNYSVIIVVDCGSLARTNLTEQVVSLKEQSKRPLLIEFDHHPNSEHWSDLEVRLPEKAATTEIIHDFLKTNGEEINRDLADCILTGLLSDTGNFLYSKTSTDNLSIASDMVACGARFTKIVNCLIHNQSLLTMKLWGLAFNNLRLNKKYNLAFSVLTRPEVDEILKTATSEELDRFSGQDIFGEIAGWLSNISGVAAIMLLREEPEGLVKGSLRSAQDGVDVSKLARKFGGGGHPKASGFTLNGHLLKDDDKWKIV